MASILGNVSCVPETRPRHHDKLYFPDGDIILSAISVAESLSKTSVLLRVHKFILSHHSAVFKDMFSLSEVPEINKMYDGVPVVDMTDSAEDLVGLVTALYDPKEPVMQGDPSSTLQARGTLKLCDKYETPSVRNRIVERTEALWPQGLRLWYLERCAFEKTTVFQHIIDPWDDDPAESSFAEPVSTIRFATEFKMPQVLPMAYYRLAVSVPGLQWGQHRDNTAMAARWDLLQREDWGRYTKGKATLIRRYDELYEVYHESAQGECRDLDDCRAARAKVRKMLQDKFDAQYAQQPDILWRIFQTLENRDYHGIFCSECGYRVREGLRDLLIDIWRDLPRIFYVETV